MRPLALLGASLVWAVFLAHAGGALGACAGLLHVAAAVLVAVWWRVERPRVASFGDELATPRRGRPAPEAPPVIVRCVPDGYLPPEQVRVVR